MTDLPETGVGPARERRFTIRSMMLTVLLSGAVFAWLLGLYRASGRAGVATVGIYGLVAQIQQDEPSVGMTETTGWGQFDLLGAESTGRSRLSTPSGSELTITVTVRAGVFRKATGEAVFEAAGRTVTWPFEDVERGRKFDARAEFPEVFR